MFKTQILKPTKQNIELAKAALLNGDLVGMPTETVYGLAANALDSSAIEKIFIAKNRPQDNPLIVHVHKDYDLNSLVKSIPNNAKKLIKHFTPGPLTIIFESKGTISPLVSRGLGTIAIRIPNHKVAAKLLKQSNLPLAAPSANISSRMSATTAQEVYDELAGKLPVILDGKKCSVGIESTVIDVTSEIPTILRPGIITKKQIEKVIGTVNEKTKLVEGQKVQSPGMKYKHYSPSVPVYVAKRDQINQVLQAYKGQTDSNKNPVIIYQNNDKHYFKNYNTVLIGKNNVVSAKKLYTALRVAEKQYDYIFIYETSKNDIGDSVMNRILKMNSENNSLS